MSGVPRVGIGLPVYNGENFLAEALDSILNQTFTDFEVVIADNASTDATEEICRRYERLDPRIRYVRSETNLGAAPNFNRALELCRGEYFRWAAHDDTSDPDFLRQAVEVLDSDPSVVLCHCKVRIVNAHGEKVEDYDGSLRTDSERAPQRFYDLLFVPNRCYEVFGLIRRTAVAGTGLIGGFPVGDRVFLSELAFRGRFQQIPEYLFFSREHEDRSVRQMFSQQERAPWFDARYVGRITFPEWRTFAEYVKAIQRSPLRGQDRFRCQLYMLKWLRHYRKRMRRDLLVAAGAWLIRAGDRWQ